MGYRTNYTLTVIDPGTRERSPRTREVVSILRDENVEAQYSLDEMGFVSGNDSRWYEHEKDMRAFSSRHPDLIFQLDGRGEESGDIWRKYFVEGKMQEARVVIDFPPLDLSKLT